MMLTFFRQHWFLTTLGLLIAGGMTVGGLGYGPQAEPLVDRLNPRWITAGVLFLMAFSLSSEHLTAAFRAPLPVALGCLMNFGAVPLLAWPLLPLQRSEDFRYGLMIAAAVPCTTAAASVMTRKAQGNDAVSLLTTVATNLSCFVLTPLWLQWTTARDVRLDTGQLMFDLLQAVLLPTVIGQALRQPRRFREFAVRQKAGIGVAAQVLIEVMVLTAAVRAGTALRAMSGAQSTLAGLAIVWSSCLAVHLVALAGGWRLARRLGCGIPESAAVAFAGSQKTLPIGLYIAGLAGPSLPFAMFPMLLYHTSQLFCDTWIASRLARSAQRSERTVND